MLMSLFRGNRGGRTFNHRRRTFINSDQAGGFSGRYKKEVHNVIERVNWS